MKNKKISILLVLTLLLAVTPIATVTAYAVDSDFSISGGVLVAYTGTQSDVVIPSGVTSIGAGAFKEKDIKSVVIPEGVTEIGERAFFGCDSLTSVSLPNSLRKIGKDAFYWCDFPELTVPEGVTEIYANAFSANDSLKRLTLPSTLTAVGEDICKYSDNITDVTLLPGKTEETWVKARNNTLRTGWLNPGECFQGAVTSEIKKLANELTSGTSDDKAKLKIIYDWVAENIYYDWDYFTGVTSQTAISASDVLSLKRTVCEGYSNLLQSLLNAAGIPCIKVKGFALGCGTTGHWTDYCSQLTTLTSNHAWNEAYINGSWVNIDVTWGSKNEYRNGSWKKDGVNSRYLNMDIQTLSDEHLITYREKASEANTPSDWAVAGTREAIVNGLLPYDLQCNYNQNITRVEFCRLMVIVLEKATKMDIDTLLKKAGLIAVDNFTDTDDQNILSVYALGIVNGKGGGLFDPNGQITRQEAAAMLSRCINISDRTTSPWPAVETVDFHDKADFASWSTDSIANVVKMGVMNGTGNGAFDPTGTYTRQQAYLTMLRMTTTIQGMTTPRIQKAPNTTSTDVFSYRSMGKELSISKYNGTEANITLPISTNGVKVVAIDGLAFQNCSSIVTVTIPEGIWFLSGATFVSCPKLTTVTFPKTVSRLESSTFVNCASLTSVTIPASITYIGDSVFVNCPNVTIYTTANSCAHLYAQKNGIKFSLI